MTNRRTARASSGTRAWLIGATSASMAIVRATATAKSATPPSRNQWRRSRRPSATIAAPSAAHPTVTAGPSNCSAIAIDSSVNASAAKWIAYSRRRASSPAASALPERRNRSDGAGIARWIGDQEVGGGKHQQAVQVQPCDVRRRRAVLPFEKACAVAPRARSHRRRRSSAGPGRASGRRGAPPSTRERERHRHPGPRNRRRPRPLAAIPPASISATSHTSSATLILRG